MIRTRHASTATWPANSTLSDDLARRAMAAAARVGDAHAIHERRATLRRVLDDAGIDLSPATEQFAEDLLRDMANP